MAVVFSEKKYENYGRCLFMTNGIITLGATLEVGPRIIYLSRNGRDNVLFQDIDRRFTEEVQGFGTWYAYGGHRLWSAPEIKPDTYYPDNSPVTVTRDGDTVILTAPVTSQGRRFSLGITMSPEAPAVDIRHRIENTSDIAVELAPWSVTGLRAGGVCLIPLSRRKTGFLPNRVMSLWDYSDIYDSRFRLTNETARLRQDSYVKHPFKAGFNVEDGFAAYAVAGQLFVKAFGEYEPLRYPDHSCNFEVYTNELFLECELLGELRSLEPGESAGLRETWYLFDDPDNRESDIEVVKELLNSLE